MLSILTPNRRPARDRRPSSSTPGTTSTTSTTSTSTSTSTLTTPATTPAADGASSVRRPAAAGADHDASAQAQQQVAELNRALDTLNEIFPGVEADEFRRVLLESSPESRLHVATELLLRAPRRGDVRKGAAAAAAGATGRKLETWEKFRSGEYQLAATKLLCKEFKGLSKSTVNGVMAEHNYDYARARATLSEISSKSWRVSFSRFFFRRSTKASSAAAPSPFGSAAATTTPTTGCEELDAELFALSREERALQVTADRALAERLNEAEHAAADELVECECCYGDYAWEQTAACTAGHFFCTTCLVRTVHEGIYGQGSNVVAEQCTVRCLSSAAQPACRALVARDLLRAALPDDVYAALEERTAAHSLERSGLKLVRCAFCAYAEVDELQPCYVKRAALAALLGVLAVAGGVLASLWGRRWVAELVLGAVLVPVSLALVVLPSSSASAVRVPWLGRCWYVRELVRRVQLRRRGTLFRCDNPRCGKESCVECEKEWTPFHKCFEKEEDGVRIFVEKAMADAVKRTCPLCHVSFVKSDGCNKLTCPCGYIMCYICRADIRTVGYRHFCQHFRVNPGTPCTECDSCNLYAQEDEVAAIRKAAKAAEDEYWRDHGKPQGWRWKGAPGPGPGPGGTGAGAAGILLQPNSLNELLDLAHSSLDAFLERILDAALEPPPPPPPPLQ